MKKRMNNSKSIKKTLDGIRKQGLYIKFKDNAQQVDRERVYYELKNLLADDAAVTSFIDEIIQSSEEIKEIMEIVFLVLGIIALILSFFLIWTSFYSNIKENICEYGIIRSIGVNIKQSTRIYMYEAACIIISSVITGTFIGIVISVTLILQFDMFAELPFVFNFPYKLYISLVSFGVFIGMLGSYYPTYEVNHMSLIKIMKGYTE
jgi:ABC-type antimicrobial peptide transport system permease subunit